MKRTLVLKSEALSELSTGELRAVAGGNSRYCASQDCYTAAFTCFLSLAICDATVVGCA